MSCQEFEVRLGPYMDGELPVSETAAADAHSAECERCAALARRQRELRQLLRRQPREAASFELRGRIVAQIRREARRAALRPWLIAPGLAAGAAALVVTVLLPALRQPSPLVSDLVDKHIAYAQIDRPAELASADPAKIVEWFRQRAGLRVTVPDYSPSGIRLVGARLAETHERHAAYLLYEKGRTLLSVFMVPATERDPALNGSRISYRGHEYVTQERKGYRTVSWTDGRTIYGLVSMLDYDALLECADRLRAERATHTSL